MRNHYEAEEMEGWTTSASISQMLTSLFGFRSKDPVYNFRKFALPSLIRMLWIVASWGLCIYVIAMCVVNPVNAIDRGQKEYADAVSGEKAQKLAFVQQTLSYSQRVLAPINYAEFLQGKRPDSSEFLALKRSISENPEVADVLLSSSTGVESLFGTPAFDVVEDFGQSVKSAKIGSSLKTLVKFDSPTIKQQWIAVVWKEAPSFHKATDQTSKYVLESLGADCILLLELAVGLLLIRLYCELVILFFRFVDEVVAIHNTMKEQKNRN